MSAPGWGVSFSADCPHVRGEGYSCMICLAEATGHAAVEGGDHHGRFFAIVCPHHASEAGWAEVKWCMIDWMTAGLLARDGGPGPAGAPEVRHGGHLDPLPAHSHEAAQ